MPPRGMIGNTPRLGAGGTTASLGTGAPSRAGRPPGTGTERPRYQLAAWPPPVLSPLPGML